jgi:hypothetical protein
MRDWVKGRFDQEHHDNMRRLVALTGVDDITDGLKELLAGMGPGDARNFDDVNGKVRIKGFALGLLEHLPEPTYFHSKDRADGSWFTTTPRGYALGVLIRSCKLKPKRKGKR